MVFTEFRDATRQLRRRPLIALVICSVVATAIAANTALFSIVDNVLLKPLPYRESDRLVSLRVPVAEYQRLTPGERARLISVATHTPLLQDRAIERYSSLFEAEDSGLVARAVSPNLFAVLGVAPMMGAGFSSTDATLEPPAIVVGHDVWRTRFAGDPHIVGRKLTVQDREVVIAGVMPRGFEFPWGTNVWNPIPDRQENSLPSIARLAEGATVEQLRSELAPVEVRLLEDVVRPKGGLTLLLLLAGSGFLLLIAWTQIAAIQLARFPDRVREIGVRLALGASRAQITRQFAIEALILSAVALAVAWPLSLSLADAATELIPAGLFSGRHVTADLRVFAFACALSVFGVLISAVIPGAFVLHQSAANSLRGDVTAGSGRTGASRIRRALIVLQLAVTALLVYLSGLAAHAFIRVNQVDVGFNPDKVFVVSLSEPSSAVRSSARRAQRVRELIESVQHLESVSAAAGATTYPFRDASFRAGLTLPGVAGWEPLPVRLNYVTPDYFGTLRQPVVEGGLPGTLERPAAVVNETLAGALVAHGQVVGRQITVGGFIGDVVAVARDTTDARPDVPPDPQVYVLSTSGIANAVVRLRTGTPDAVTALQGVVDRVSQPYKGGVVRSLEAERQRANAEYYARMWLLFAIAAIGLALAALGLAGGLYHEVRLQTRSIAIRTALGASSSDIMWSVLGGALGRATAAAAAGCVAGALIGRAAQSLLFNVQGVDGATVGGVVLVLAGLAMAASYPAVRQALNVDPAVALRRE